MKALICETLGEPQTLKLLDWPEPAPAAGEALIEVAYAALNFFDTLIVQGKYQVKPAPPFSPGGEFSGRIIALGEGAEGFAPGDRVIGYITHGAARERIVAPVSSLSKLPDSLPLDKAAGLAIAYGTTLHALDQRGDLKPGETLVVLGASGGVGLAAVEIGARMGARVIACASSDEKIAFAKAHGAAEGVNYANHDLRDALRRLAAPGGVDVVYDPVGGSQTEVALRSLGWKGRLLVVGFASGEIPRPPLNLVLLKGCDIRGVYWSDFLRREPEAHRANMTRLIAWTARGELSAHVHSVHQPEDFLQGFREISERKALGKVLLRFGASPRP